MNTLFLGKLCSGHPIEGHVNVTGNEFALVFLFPLPNGSNSHVHSSKGTPVSPHHPIDAPESPLQTQPLWPLYEASVHTQGNAQVSKSGGNVRSTLEIRQAFKNRNLKEGFK